MHRHAPAVARAGILEKGLVLRISLAEHDELHILFHDGVERLADKVQPLVGNKARDHRDDGRIGPFL